MNNEQILTWQKMSAAQQEMVIAAHLAGLRTNKKEALIKIFTIANPEVVIGSEPKPYCRINTGSVDIMKLLIAQYL